MTKSTDPNRWRKTPAALTSRGNMPEGPTKPYKIWLDFQREVNSYDVNAKDYVSLRQEQEHRNTAAGNAAIDAFKDALKEEFGEKAPICEIPKTFNGLLTAHLHPGQSPFIERMNGVQAVKELDAAPDFELWKKRLRHAPAETNVSAIS